jgi:integrase
VSEVLSLDRSDFEGISGDYVVRRRVTGKGGSEYDLRFLKSVEPIKAYLAARDDQESPLFISHHWRSPGARLTRGAAYRVVSGAAKALGLESVSPHDLRHWRATQLVNAGQPLDVIQDMLGHQSVETTRAYYAHTRQERLDQAMAAGM